MKFIIVVAFASLLIGLSKGGLGGPIPVALLTPILSQVMTAPQAVGITLPLLIFADVLALRSYWRQWDWQQVKLLLPMAILGVFVGTLVLALLATRPDDTLLRHSIGVLALIVVVYKLSSNYFRQVQYRHQNWHSYLAGAVSGFGSALANVGSPSFTAYMLLQSVSPEVFIANTTLFFAIMNLLKVPGVIYFGLLDFHQLYSIAWSLPLIPIGVWVGRALVQRINPKIFEWSMLILLLWMSFSLLFSSR